MKLKEILVKRKLRVFLLMYFVLVVWVSFVVFEFIVNRIEKKMNLI